MPKAVLFNPGDDDGFNDIRSEWLSRGKTFRVKDEGYNKALQNETRRPPSGLMSRDGKLIAKRLGETSQWSPNGRYVFNVIWLGPGDNDSQLRVADVERGQVIFRKAISLTGTSHGYPRWRDNRIIEIAYSRVGKQYKRAFRIR